MRFNSTGKFGEWKASLVGMLANILLEKHSSATCKLHCPLIVAAMQIITAAQSFSQVFQALKAVQPFSTSLAILIAELEKVDKLRVYAVGGCDAMLIDAYAQHVKDENETRRLVAEVEKAMDAVRHFLRTGEEADYGLDAFQRRLYQLATLNERNNKR